MTLSQHAIRIDRGLDQIFLRMKKIYPEYSDHHIRDRIAERAKARAE